MDFIGKEETFDKDFKRLCSRIGVSPKIRSKNVINDRKSGEKYKYLDKYDQETLSFVNHVYKKDFEEFGYEVIENL